MQTRMIVLVKISSHAKFFVDKHHQVAVPQVFSRPILAFGYSLVAMARSTISFAVLETDFKVLGLCAKTYFRNSLIAVGLDAYATGCGMDLFN